MDVAAFNRFEAAGWEQKATGYDSFFGRLTSTVIEPLLDAAQVGSGTRVLDVGTGPGYVAAAAHGRGAQAIGVDIAEAMLALARQRAPGAEFHLASAEALPFADASVDAVVANFAILHLGRPDQAVREFGRVLRPGGGLAMTVWDLPEHMRIIGVFLDAIAEAGATAPESIPAGPPFFTFADDQAFAELLTDAGFHEATVERIAFEHGVSSADELWDGILAGTVRTAPLIAGQPDEVRQRVRAAFDRAMEAYRRDDAFAVPVSVKLASGRKPG